MRYIFALGILVFFMIDAKAQMIGEKKALMEKALNQNSYSEFGELFFEKNGKDYWLATFTAITSDNAYDYYRLFELKLDSGYVKEVTSKMLGGFYPVEGLNPPYHYLDLDSDGIKDIFIVDHGKEVESLRGSWGTKNMFFKGTSDGFVNVEIKGITDVKGYHHGHSVADFDGDGDLDITFNDDKKGVQIFQNKGNLNFEVMPQINGGYNIYGLRFINLDEDPELELIGPPYREFANFKGQTKMYNLVNGAWLVTNYGQQSPFPNGETWGCAQILPFARANSKQQDMIFRIEGQNPNDNGWYSKYFRNDANDFNKIVPIKSIFQDTAKFYFIDPKIADINFDGVDDLVFKENNYSQYQIFGDGFKTFGGNARLQNERIWINDGKNNFDPIPFKFPTNINKSVYLYVKTNPAKKYHLYMSNSSVLIFPNKGDYVNKDNFMYNRFDSLIFPKVEKQKLSVCQGISVKYDPAHVPVNISISKSGKLGTTTLANNLITYTASVAGVDSISYHLKNSFFESSDYQIKYTVLPSPKAPTITREGNTTLISSTPTGNQWYLDGSIIKGEVGQKINATVNGLYSVKYTDANGCLSENSASLYGLITGTGLSDKKVIISPNPFEQSIKIEFPEDFGPMVSAKIHDVKGVVVWEKESVRDSEIVDLSSLSVGNYVLNLTSQTNGQMSVVKISKLGR
jgi:hypothetical protein